MCIGTLGSIWSIILADLKQIFDKYNVKSPTVIESRVQEQKNHFHAVSYSACVPTLLPPE